MKSADLQENDEEFSLCQPLLCSVSAKNPRLLQPLPNRGNSVRARLCRHLPHLAPNLLPHFSGGEEASLKRKKTRLVQGGSVALLTTLVFGTGQAM